MRVRLTKKLADRLNGIDVSAVQIGGIVDLPDRAALVLIAEGWAEAVDTLVVGPTSRDLPRTPIRDQKP